MKTLRLIIALLLVGLALGANAQVTRRTGDDARKKDKKEGGVTITDRQQAFYEVKEPHDADLQWMKVIYRSIDLTKGKNAALYYPEIPNEDGANLYFIIMRLLAKNQLAAYEYLPDGREMFTEEYRIKDVGEMFTRFQLYYTEAKGSTEKNPIYEFEDADIRGNEVLAYYIIEKWEFDTRSNQMRPRVEALCPVMVQVDDFTGESMPYPMFWVKLNDIRPYMAQQYVFTDDDNNLPRYSIDDFFKLNMYTGEIIKTKNLRNKPLKELFPDAKAYKHAQDSIEQRLRSFNQDLWVPPLEVLQARAEAEEKARAEAEGEVTEGEEGAEQVEGEAAGDGEEQAVTRTTKRGSKAKSSDKKSSKSNLKSKKTKIKERKPKTSTQTVNTGVRSVRNRKKK
jgi:gliding motility associated protien GldN